MRNFSLLLLIAASTACNACGGGGGGGQGSGGAAGVGGLVASGGQTASGGGATTGGTTGTGGALPASGGGTGAGGTPGTGGGAPGGGGASSGGAANGTGGDASGGGGGELEWLPSWATTIQRTEASNEPTTSLPGKTLRQFVWPTVSGSQIRIQLSNERGNGPVDLAKVHIALAKTAGDPANSMGDIDSATDAAFTFGGMPNVTIAAGQTAWSDPLDFPLEEITLTAISLQFGATVPSDITGHPGARTTSYIADGDVVSAETITEVETRDRWYFIDALEVMAPADAYAVAILGDSITDGYGIINDFARWPDFLTLAMKEDPTLATNVSVLNFGMGANTLAPVPNASNPDQDPGTVRFERDVLAREKIKTLIVLEGTNDVNGGPDDPGQRCIDALESIIMQAEAAGIEVFVSPITPMNASNAERDQLNTWIRASSNYDEGIDLDIAIRDPSNTNNMASQYERSDGDDLHPSDVGYQAMGESIDLTLLYP